MKKNVGVFDRGARAIIGLLLGFLVLNGTFTGVPGIIFGVVAVVMLLTGFVGFCPLYRLLKLSTGPKEAAKQ